MLIASINWKVSLEEGHSTVSPFHNLGSVIGLPLLSIASARMLGLPCELKSCVTSRGVGGQSGASCLGKGGVKDQ